MCKLEATQEPGKEITFGLAGIGIFCLFSILLWFGSSELNGSAFFFARSGALMFAALALLALAGSAYGGLLWLIPATEVELDREILYAGQPFQARLTQRGPLLVNSIVVELICSQTGFDEEEREWVHALVSNQRPVRIEELDPQFEDVELMRTSCSARHVATSPGPSLSK